MKKIIASTLAAVVLIASASCAEKNETTAAETTVYETEAALPPPETLLPIENITEAETTLTETTAEETAVPETTFEETEAAETTAEETEAPETTAPETTEKETKPPETTAEAETVPADTTEPVRVERDDTEKWDKIAAEWKKMQSGTELNYDVLPDGLPDDDSLCLVALGYQLNPDGSMTDELSGRLTVLKNCAEKYKNALIVCSGGGTADNNYKATEAGQMAKWLTENGVDKSRIIIEDTSTSTARNAIYTLDILTEKYPQVNRLAIITSDYHVPVSLLLFRVETIVRGAEYIEVVSSAAYKAPSGRLSDTFIENNLTKLTGDRETVVKICGGEY